MKTPHDPYGPERPTDLQAPDLSHAAPLARSIGQRVIIADRLTATSTTYVLPSGEFETVIHAAPVHVRTAAGWANVNTTVIPRGSRIGPAVTAAAPTFSRGGDAALTREDTADGPLGWDWSTALPKPVVVGREASYRNVAPGLDLIVRAMSSGYEVSFVVKQRPKAPLSLRLPLLLPAGYTVTVDGHGGAEVRNAAGKTVQAISPSLVHDATLAADGEYTHVDMATTSVDTSGNRPALVITPDESFLANPATVFPVTIDPTATWVIDPDDGTGGGDTYTSAAFPTTNYASATDMYVGYSFSNYERRLYMKLDVTPVLGATIDQAYMGLYMLSSECNDNDVQLGLSSGGWNINSLTWNSQPGFFSGYDVTHFYGGNAGSAGGSACGASPSGESGGQHYYSGTATILARQLAAGASSGGQLVEVRTTDTTNYQWFEAASTQYSNTDATDPYISFYAATVPSPPQNPSLSCGNTSATASWQAPADTGNTDNYTYTLNLYQNGSLDRTVANLANSNTSWNFATLNNGSSYYYTITASNIAGTSSAAQSNSCVPSTTPSAPPSVTASATHSTTSVTWTAANGNGASIDYYSVTRHDATDGSNLSYTSAGLAAGPDTATYGHSYYYLVSAHNVNGSGAQTQSNTVTVVDPPNAPGITSLTEDQGVHSGTTSVTVAFALGSSNGSTQDTCEAQAFDPGPPLVVRGTATGPCAAGSLDVTGLAYNRQYSFRVAAHNGAPTSNNSDLGTGWSSWSVTQSVTTGGPVTVAKSISSPRGGSSQPSYDHGEAVTYTVTVHNPNSACTGSWPNCTGGHDTVSTITDTIPTGLDVGPAPVVEITTGGATTPCAGCTLSGSTLTVPGGNAFAPGETRTYQITGVLTGTPGSGTSDSARLCQTVTNSVNVVDDYTTTPATAQAADVCNADLGIEPWWNYLTSTVGVQSVASVNVANGNLVVSATDSTPVQAHGRLAFVLRRTYNSQDTTRLSLPNSLGQGWQLNLGATDDLADAGVTPTGLTVPTVQNLTDAVTNPLAVTLIDRDGTRHVFAANQIKTTAQVTTGINVLPGTGTLPGLLQTLVPNVLTLPAAPTGQLAYTNLCVDTTYTPPPGVHLALWRYIAIRSTVSATAPDACLSTNRSTQTTPTVVGYVTERPDRMRSEFQVPLDQPTAAPLLPVGELVDLLDGAGNHLHYTYNPAGLLTAVSEADCSGCRSMTISYYNGTTDVTTTATPTTTITSATVIDAAHLHTTYTFAASNGMRLLTQVTNPDGTSVRYGYQGDGTTPSCGGSAGQLCTITDERGNTTRFAYNGNAAGDPTLGPPRVTRVTNRRGYATTVAYSDANSRAGGSTTVTELAAGNGADAANNDRQQVYGPIDGDGRVWQLLEGTGGVTTANAFRITQTSWDGTDPTGATTPGCVIDGSRRQNNNRCTVRILGSDNHASSQIPTADDTRLFTYDDAGMLVRQAVCLATVIPAGSTVPVCKDSTLSAGTGTGSTADDFLITTYGYDRQYAYTDGTVSTASDQIAAGGAVSQSAPTPASAPGSAVLYTLADRTALLPPRGNRTNATPADYETTYAVDDLSSVAPNQTGGASPCTNGTTTGVAAANTGLLCATHMPYAGGTATTTDGYDGYGQRTSTTSPNGNTTRFGYYADTDKDLSGSTAAGGWLKTVTDPTGHFVAYGYDAAGHLVRTWDRNATTGHLPSDYPGQVGPIGVAPGAYTQTTYGMNNATDPQTAFTTPWRFVTSTADQQTSVTSRPATTYTDDAAGNPTTVTDAHGNATTNTYDADNNLTRTLAPAEAQLTPQAPTVNGYDAFDERVTTTSPTQAQLNAGAGTNGHGVSARFYYDPVGGLSETDTVRDDTATGPAPVGCYVTTTASDPALPTGALVCRTTQVYDSVDNLIYSTDAAAQASWFGYDSAHRRTDAYTPTTDTSHPRSHTETLYDPNGNVTTLCSPRQFAEGGGGCTDTTSGYVTHSSYDVADRLASTSNYRSVGGPALTTCYRYDADGNQTSVVDANATTPCNDPAHTTTNVYDALDRLVETDTPRNYQGQTALATYFLYDPVGDRTATIAPGISGDNVNTETRVAAADFDVDHRVIDTVTGLQVTFDTTKQLSDPAQNTAITAALTAATATGTTNTRYRQVYDAVGNIVARYEPRAFTTTVPSITDATYPDAIGGFASPYMLRIHYDPDNRPTVQYSPRTGNAAPDPNAAALTSGSPEANQCSATGPTDTGQPTYPGDVRTCTTTVGYDPDGNAATVTLPTATASTGNRRVDYTYSADDIVEAISGPDPSATTAGTGRTSLAAYTLDGAGRVTAATDPLGRTTYTSYNPAGTVAEVDNPPASSGMVHRTRYGYDTNGNRITVTVPRTPAGATITATSATENDTTTTSYTADDLVASINTPAATTTDSETTSYTYDGVGNTLSTTSPSANAADATNPNGIATVNTYTGDNLLATTVAPNTRDGSRLRRTTYSYDPAGRKTGVVTDIVGPQSNGIYPTIAAGAPESFSYGPNDRMTEQGGRADASTETIDTSYDAAGDPTCWLDGPPAVDSCATPGNGRTAIAATYYLDGLTRTVTETPTTPTPVATRTSKYSYDGTGALTARAQDTASGATTTTTYTRNDADAVLAMAAPLESATATTWTYNKAGQPARETDPNGTVRSWAYDNTGDDTLTGLGLSSSAANANSGTYDLAHYTYSYDENYRILTDTHTGVAAGTVAPLPTTTYTYAYRPDGRLASFVNGSTQQSLTWDHDGNRLTYGNQTYTYNPDDTIATSKKDATSSTHTYSYDTYGRLHDDGCSTYAYDGFDRSYTTYINRTSDPSCPQGVTSTQDAMTYYYDGLDRQVGRFETQTPLTGSGTSNTTHLYYDGTSQTTTGEKRYGNNTSVDYTLTADGQSHAAIDSTSTLQYLLGDGQGNITVATTSTGGMTGVACAVRYDPFGNTIDDTTNAPTATGACMTGTTISNVLYHGTRRDISTKDYQLGARTYDPTKAAFTTPDTYRDAPSTDNLGIQTDPLTANTYSYVNGDPINYDDPTGHRLEADTGGGCGNTAADCQRTSKAIDRAVQTYVARTTPVHHEHHCAWYNAGCQIHKVVHAAKRVGEGAANLVGGAAAGIVDEATSTVTLGLYDPGFGGCLFGGHGAVAAACKAGRIIGRGATIAASLAATGGAAGALSKVGKIARALREADEFGVTGGRGATFVVDARGTTIPTDPVRLRAGLEDSGAFQDVSTNPATSRKFVGMDDGDPIRIRIEKGHFDDPTYTGPPDPLHTVDHLHVERRANGATGPWTEAWKIPYDWPF